MIDFGGQTRKIVVGIPSYKRPEGLEKCLRTIEAQICDVPDTQITVIVAENDLIDRAAMAVVARLAPNFRFKLHGYLSDRRGISSARNTLLDHGFGTHNAWALAMLDDDQWIEPDWLNQMFSLMIQHDSDVVGCNALPDFMGAPPQWLHQHPIFRRLPYYSAKGTILPSGPIPFLHSTCGILLNRRVLDILPDPQFSEFFTLLGAEDTDFLLHLKNAGGRFAFSDLAISHECYPLDRQTVAWTRQRSERIGMTDVLLGRRHKRETRRDWQIIIRSFINLAKISLRAIARTGRPLEREIEIARIYLIKGQLRALTGRLFEVYR